SSQIPALFRHVLTRDDPVLEGLHTAGEASGLGGGRGAVRADLTTGGMTYGFAVDPDRAADRAGHHHVRPGPEFGAIRFRPSGPTAEGGGGGPGLSAASAAGDLLRPGAGVPAAADAGGRHDAAGGLARRDDGQPL